MPLNRLPLTTGVSGTLPIGNGGTNVTTSADLANTGNLVKIATNTVTSGDQYITFDLSSVCETSSWTSIMSQDHALASAGA